MRAVREVAVGAEVDVAERLEVRDLRRAEPRLLRRREAEEELRTVGDEVGALDRAAASAICFGRPDAAVEAAAREALADARHAEQAVQIVEERRRSRGDVVEDVAAQQHGDVVLLEQRRLRVAREADRVLEHAHRSLPRAADARRSSGRCRSACAGTKRSKYGSPQATVTPRPAGVGSKRSSSRLSAFSSSARASLRSPGRSATRTAAVTTW